MKIPQGFLFSGVSSGVKKSHRLDLGLVYSPDFAEGAYFFTDNKVKAAPLILSMRKIKRNKGKIKAIIVNSGNANCFIGKKGLDDAETICGKVSQLLREDSKYILPSSTGIIGKRLCLTKISKSLSKLTQGLGKNISDFAESILTTDTFKKISYKEVTIKKEKIRILGVAKGAGMIYPHLKQATMLSFIFTDINIKNSLLKEASRLAMENSFNSISVDACRSTNDSAFVLTSKKADKVFLQNKDKDFKIFAKSLEEVCLNLAKMIVKDGEGASKFVEIYLKGAKTKNEAKKAAFSIANSNLFKCALFGSNPNWGRIVAALGQAGIKVKENISINSTSLKNREIKITVDLKRGCFSRRVYTSDLTPQYVKINAKYN
ncbi:MAG: bifunctional glutamate N-acetyltransferase/amino-acid acetyltransferase ArgJ [Candidatus Omnitrophota bacterium]